MLLEYLQGITVIFRIQIFRIHKQTYMSFRLKLPCLLQTGFLTLVTVCVLLQGGCASQGATLKVKPRHDAGIQYAPREISGIMEILGYAQLRVPDPDTGKSVPVATGNGVYRLLFQYRDNNSIRVDVHILSGNGNIGLHVYQADRETLDDAAILQYDRLRQRLKLQYGAEHVSDSHPLLAP